MKLMSTFFLITITKIVASFSTEFRNAVHSVEDSFGKLVTDVVTDVKDTISCTLMAVERVFAFNRFDRSSEYYKKCNGEYGSNGVTKKVQERPVISNYKILHEQQSNKYNVQPKIPLISTGNGYLYKRDRHNNLDNMKNVLSSQSNRLAQVSAVIRKELDAMSNGVRKRFNVFELNGRSPSVDSVWNHIKLLYDLEQEQGNSPEATEIHRTIDKVLDVLEIHENANTPEKDKIKDIMKKIESAPNDKLNSIENQLSVLKHNETDQINEMQPLIKKQNIQTKKGRQIDEFPRTFKDVAKNIVENKNISNVNSSNNYETITNTESLPVLNISKPLTSTVIPVSNAEMEDYDSFFQSSNESEGKLAADQANQIIEDSKRSQMIFDSLSGL